MTGNNSNNMWVIVSGGDFPGKMEQEYLSRADYIVCADGGGNHLLRLRCKANIVIGDADSLSKEAADYLNDSGAQFLSYPQTKDYTDTQLAVEYAASHGAGLIVIIAAGGGRIDHLLANVMLLANDSPSCRIRIIHENSILFLCDGHELLTGSPNDMLTVLPLTPVVYGVSLHGFKYPLELKDIRMGDNIGVSNEFIGGEANIHVRAGRLLIIHTVADLSDIGN